MVVDAVQPKIEQDLYIGDELDSFMFVDEPEINEVINVNDDKIQISPPVDYTDIKKSLNTTNKKKYHHVIKISSASEDEITYVKSTPSHPRDRLRWKQDEITYVKTTHSHPRDRLRQKQDEITYVKTTVSHPRDRLRRKLNKKDEKKKEKGGIIAVDNDDDDDDEDKDIDFVRITPSHPRDRLCRKIRNKNRNVSDLYVTITKVNPLHPQHRMDCILRNWLANISVDANVLKDLPCFNAKIKVGEVDKYKRREVIIDKLQLKLE